MTTDAKVAFRQEIQKEDEAIDLFYAGLLFTQHLTEIGKLELHLETLNRLVEAIQPEISHATTEVEQLDIYRDIELI